MIYRSISKAFCAALTSLLAMSASADYVATGDIEGQACSGFGIQSCSHVSVDAVEGDDGRLHTVKRRYSSVSDYNANKGRCWIETKARGGGVIGWVAGAISGPDFYTETEDGFKKVDIDYITFPCRET